MSIVNSIGFSRNGGAGLVAFVETRMGWNGDYLIFAEGSGGLYGVYHDWNGWIVRLDVGTFGRIVWASREGGM